jgi:hypothetical protein
MTTVAEWWSAEHEGAARWRRARVAQRCGNQRFDNERCCPAGSDGNAIEPGDRYFDTAELIDPPWRTLHLCAACSGRTVER